MSKRRALIAAIAVALFLFASAATPVGAQGKAASAKALRCTFPLNTTGTWSTAGSPNAVVHPSTLVLRFNAINTDEGSADLRNGSVGTGITAQLAGPNLHFIQSFRTGPLYLTTVFDQETSSGRLRAVHSRHESFKVPLDGATSSPEQYYGECEIVSQP